MNQQIYEQVNLFFNIRNLDLHDLAFEKQIVVVLKEKLENNYSKIIASSNQVFGSKNIDFEFPFLLNYHFERLQAFIIEVINIKDRGDTSGRVIGKAHFDLGEVAGSPDCLKIYNLDDDVSKETGKIILRIEKTTKGISKRITFTLNVGNIPKKGFLASQISFVKIFRAVESQGQSSNLWQIVKETPSFEGKNISLGKLTLNSALLYKNDEKTKIKFEVWKFKENGSHYPLSFIELTINEMLSGKRSFRMSSVDGKNESAIEIEFIDFMAKEHFGFIDYLQGNLNLLQHISIDFTASNGNPKNSSSLHYMSNNKPNLYQQAIMAIGQILEFYNKSRFLIANGFGAVVNNFGDTNHLFPLNIDTQNPVFDSFPSVFQAYTHTLSKIKLSGPTNFSPTIINAIQYAIEMSKTNPMSYLIVTIFTDGVISDLQQTINQIVEASFHAISLIIVGIGKADFSAMEKLDGDKHPLYDSSGRKVMRDIVQFVPFEQLNNNPIKLREEVLAELPYQVEDYMNANNIRPTINQNIQQ